MRPGASRTLYVVYPGTQILRSAISDLRERFNGKLSVNASRITAGGKLVVTGVVKGGHIPSGGVNVTIEYRQAGAPGSGTLGTVRTDSKGRYRFVQHFAANTQGSGLRALGCDPRKSTEVALPESHDPQAGKAHPLITRLSPVRPPRLAGGPPSRPTL